MIKAKRLLGLLLYQLLDDDLQPGACAAAITTRGDRRKR